MSSRLPGARPVFPSFSLGDQGKRCLDKSRRMPNPAQVLELQHHQLYHGPTYRYHKHLNFITVNNLHDNSVLETFLQATLSISQRLNSSDCQFRQNPIDIVIVIRCLSTANPKWAYYVADHSAHTVKWFDGTIPRYADVNDPKMRDAAEYWHHRSRFPAHLHCSQDDYHETRHLLDQMSAQGGESDIGLSQIEIANYSKKLDEAQSAPALEEQQTIAIAGTHSDLLKYSLPQFYRPSLSIKCKIMKSLSGVGMPRFTHNLNRAHGNTGRTMSQIIRDYQAIQGQQGTPDPSPHNSFHTGRTTPSPSSSQNSTPRHNSS